MKGLYHGFQTAEDVRQSTYRPEHVREPKKLNLFTIEYVILGIDGQVIAVRKYPPIKPKDMPSCMMSLADYKARGTP